MAQPSDIALGLGVPDASGVASFTVAAGRLNTQPPVVEMGADEEMGLSFVFDAVMTDDEQPDYDLDTIATVELLDLVSGEPHPDGLIVGPLVEGVSVTETFGGLIAGREYLATVALTTNLGNTYETGLRITCPY